MISPHGTQDIPHGTHDIPHGTEHPHGTAHTLYRVSVRLMYQSIPSLTIHWAKPPGNVLIGEFPIPRAKKSSKPPPPWPIKMS